MENSEAIVGTVNYLHYKERIIILISLSLIILLQNYDHFFIHENFKAFEIVHFYAFCKLRATNFNLGWNITKKNIFYLFYKKLNFCSELERFPLENFIWCFILQARCMLKKKIGLMPRLVLREDNKH